MCRKSVNLLTVAVLTTLILAICSARADAATTFAPFVAVNDPRYVAVDSDGNVYVALFFNNQILKFDSTGTLVATWGSGGGIAVNSPWGIAVDSSGNLYAADYFNNQILKFDSNGALVTSWGNGGGGDGQFNCPCGVAADSGGNVYVADSKNYRIQRFDSNGAFITKWGSSGGGDGQFNLPFGVAADSSGKVYVADSYNSRIQKFDSAGNFIAKWGSNGSDNGQFNVPFGLAVDTSGNIYVADSENKRIQKLDSTGQFITKWGSDGDGQFDGPFGIAADSSGNVYVADCWNNRVQLLAAPTLKATSAVKGQPVANLGKPGVTISSLTAGSANITAAQAIDTTEAAPYITLFDKNDPDTTVKVVKYASGGDTGNFDTDTAYGGEAVTNGNFFIIKLTASDMTTVSYYEIVVTVSALDAPVIQSVAVGDAYVNINWNPVAGATGYDIYMSTTSGLYGAALATVGGPVCSYNATGLSNGTTYYFVVKAANPGGESGYSNEVSAVPARTYSSGGRNNNSTTSLQPVNSNTGSAIIDPAAGGIVSLGSDVSLSIPTNALRSRDNVKVVIQEADTLPTPPAGFMVIGKAYQFTMNGKDHYNFYKPVTLTFTFDPSELPSGETPAVYYYDDAADQWVNIGGTISGNTITVTVNHFTLFAIMVKQITTPPVDQSPAKVNLIDIAGHWAKANINELIGTGAISGYPDDTFKPDSTITRAEFAAMLVKTFQLEQKSGQFFGDTSSHWARDFIATAAGCGIVSGYDSNRFGPDDYLTREQMAVMVFKAAKLNQTSGGPIFTDSKDVSAWAKDSVAATTKLGILKGYPDNSLRPQGNATKAEAVTIIVNTLDIQI